MRFIDLKLYILHDRIAHLNAKARALGMTRTRYTEPTGLSEGNLSTANDLVIAASADLLMV